MDLNNISWYDIYEEHHLQQITFDFYKTLYYVSPSSSLHNGSNIVSFPQWIPRKAFHMSIRVAVGKTIIRLQIL